MAKRFITILLFVFIISITGIAVIKLVYTDKKQPVETSLIKSMESTKAQVMESTISVWGKINDSYMTEEQVQAEINTLLEIIKPEKSTINIVKENNEATTKQTMYGSVGSRYYSVVVESIKNEKNGESFVVIDTSMDNSCSDLISERQKLEQYFTAQKLKPNISSCIIGVYDGKLEESQMHTKIADAMSAVKAKQVEGLTADDVNSISAFSGNIDSFIISNDKKINMQIAMRYSSYDNKTYIWIGSPLIQVEY